MPKTSNSNLVIEMWPIDRPTDYPKNARKWSKNAIAKVAASIKAYGFRQPIVVDRHEVIIIGHLRRTAARTLGLLEVPVHVARDLSEAQCRGLRLMDNRTALESTFDLELLGPELLELKAMDFDLSLTGFEDFELGDWNFGDSAKGINPDWSGMPEFDNQHLGPEQSILVHFAKAEDRVAFALLVNQNVTERTKSIWFPAQ